MTETDETQTQPLLDFVDLTGKFQRLTGKRISHAMEITRPGLQETFEKMIDIERRLIDSKAVPADLALMTSAADRVLNWFERKRRDFIHGETHSLRDEMEIKRILAEIGEATDPKQKQELTVRLYLNDPQLAANRAVEILGKVIAFPS